MLAALCGFGPKAIRLLDLLQALFNVLIIPGLLVGLIVGGAVGWWVVPQVLDQGANVTIIVKSALCGGVVGTVVQYTVFQQK